MYYEPLARKNRSIILLNQERIPNFAPTKNIRNNITIQQ